MPTRTRARPPRPKRRRKNGGARHRGARHGGPVRGRGHRQGRGVEAASFVPPTAIPPMAGADEVMAAITRRPGVVYSRAGAEPEGRRARDRGQGRRARARRERERDAQPEERAALGRRVARRRRATSSSSRTAPASPVEAIVSTAFGCPYEGDVAPERVAQIAGHLRRRRRRPALVRRHHRHGDARAASTTCSTRSSAPGSTPIASACTSTTRAAPRSRTCVAGARARRRRGSTRRSAGSAAVRTRPARRATRSPRISCTCSTTWGSRPASTSTRCSTARALAQDIVGRELPSALLHAGPRARGRVRVVTRRHDDSSGPRAHRAGARRAISPRKREKLARQNKLFVRDRLALLLDDGSFVEDALLANALAGDLPADGVVTGVGRDRRPPGVRDGERLRR